MQEGFQALVLVPELLLDLRARLALGRLHLLQLRFGWAVAGPEVTALVHLLEVLRDLLVCLVGSPLLPRSLQGVSLGHPVVELGRVPITVFLEEDLHVQTR